MYQISRHHGLFSETNSIDNKGQSNFILVTRKNTIDILRASWQPGAKHDRDRSVIAMGNSEIHPPHRYNMFSSRKVII